MSTITFKNITLGTLTAMTPEVAQEYNNSINYQKGNYCTFRGKLYRCIAACSSQTANRIVNTGTSSEALSSLYFSTTRIIDEIVDKTTLAYATTAEELVAIGSAAKVNDLVLDATDSNTNSVIRVTNIPIPGDYQSLISTGAAYDIIKP